MRAEQTKNRNPNLDTNSRLAAAVWEAQRPPRRAHRRGPRPLFELQPLERRLFLAADFTQASLAHYQFATGASDSPLSWWSSTSGLATDARGPTGARYLGAASGTTLTLHVGNGSCTYVPTGHYSLSFDLDVIADFDPTNGATPPLPGTVTVTASSGASRSTLLSESLADAYSGGHQVGGGVHISTVESGTGVWDYVYHFEPGFDYQTGTALDLTFQVTGLNSGTTAPTAPTPYASSGLSNVAIGIAPRDCNCGGNAATAEGIAVVTAPGVSSDNLGSPVSTATDLANDGLLDPAPTTGTGTISADQGFLTQVGASSIAAVDGGGRSRWFDPKSGGGFTTRFGGHDVLTQDTSTHLYTITAEDGTQTNYFDFTQGNVAGNMASIVSPGGPTTGLTTSFVYDSPPTPALSSGGTSTVLSTTYFVRTTYVTSGGESASSSESSIVVPDNVQLTVAAPPTVPGATGYNVYVGTSHGGETRQNLSGPLSPGSAWTEPTGGISTTGAGAPAAGAGKLLQVTRSSGTTIESFVYNYLPASDPNAGLVQSVTLVRSGAAAESTAYTYYPSGSSNGPQGTVQTVKTGDGGVASAPTLSTGSGGSLVAGTYSYVVTAVPTAGTESGASPESSITITAGQSVGVSWPSAAGMTYSVYRGTSSGDEHYLAQVTAAGTTASYSDTGTSTSAATPPYTDINYYRWNISSDGTAKLKYEFGTQDFARLVAGLTSGTPFSASDSDIEPYARAYYQYDSDGRVTLKRIAGDGDSNYGSDAGSGVTAYAGQGIHTYAYADTANYNNWGLPNAWTRKVTETMPDGNQNIKFFNSSDEVLLQVYKDTTTGQPTSGKVWCTYTQRDSDGRPILVAQPSAFVPDASGNFYDESLPDLVGYQGGNAYTYLSPNSGLVTLTDYNSDTDTVAPGYFADSSVEEGTQGTAVEQESTTYTTRSGGGVTIYPVYSTVTYGDSGGGDPRTTTYSYTWYSGTVQMQTEQVDLPLISSGSGGQNGAGTLDTSYTYLDNFGRPVWNQDAAGYIDYTAYAASGAASEEITDVDPSTVSSPPVAGPTRSMGLPAALNLTTLYTVDAQGRITLVTDPMSNKTFTVRNDATHETRVYRGWQGLSGSAATAGTTTTITDTASLGATGTYVGDTLRITSGTYSGQSATVTGYNSSTHVLTFSPALPAGVASGTSYVLGATTGPIQATRENWPAANSGGTVYEETLTSSAPPALNSDGTPSGTEDLTSTITNLKSLSRASTNHAGQTTEQDDYSTVQGLTYSTATVLSGASAATKSASNNYNKAVYGYNAEGLQWHVRDPNGTIADSFFDGQGRLTSTYVGTDDSTSTSAPWVPGSNNSTTNDMTKVEDDSYDQRLPSPAAPTLSQTGTGSTGGATQYVKVTYVTPAGETLASAESSLLVHPGNQLVVTAPATVAGATAYNVYVSTSSGDEQLQAWGQLLTSSWTEPTTGLVTGAGVPVDGVGDGNLTETAGHVDTTASHDRVTLNLFDYRDRLVASKAGALMSGTTPNPSAETDSAHRLITVYQLDNAGEATTTYTYAGDGLSLRDFANWDPTSTDTSARVAASTAGFDDQARVYRTTLFPVDASGTVGSNGLVSDTYYDSRGNDIADYIAGGMVTKNAFDGAGRNTITYTTDGAGGGGGTSSSYSAASSAGSDNVLEQVTRGYDKNGDATLLNDALRDNDYATTGALAASTTNHQDRVSSVASWYDAANRLTDTADFGTDGGQQYVYTAGNPPPGRNVVGQATATGSTTTLVDSSRPEPSNYFIGYTLTVTAGTDSGHSATVTGYSAGGTFTLSSLPSATDATSVYSLVPGAVSGTASGGSTTTLTASSLTQPAGSFVGWTLTITAGTDAGTTRTVTASATIGSLTFAPAMTAAIDSTSQYTLSLPALLGHTDFDPAGHPFRTTDARGIAAVNTFDLLGRATQTVAGWTGNAVSNSADQTTNFAFDGNGDVISQTAVMPSPTPTPTPSQTTAYIFGVTTSGGSTVNSDDLLAKTEYPDPSTGAASTSSSNDVTNTYNSLGEVATMKDENGSIHTYSRDPLGREIADAVTTLGSGVDGSVRYHGFTYTNLGLPYQSSSYASSAGTGTPLNQVLDVYNGFGQLTREYQSHSGAVVQQTPTPTPAPSPSVQYAFDGPSSTQNYSRLAAITYAGTQIVHLVYNTGIDDRTSRVSALADNGAGGTIGTHIADYLYLGPSTIVNQADQNGVTLSYIGTNTSDSGDQYTGLDRFDRIAEQKYATTTPTPTSKDDFQYAYDLDSNVLNKNNILSSGKSELYHANSTTSGDNASAYDLLNRLTAFRRGTLSASTAHNNGASGPASLDTVTTASPSESWNLDAVGNWACLTTNGTPTSRAHNSRNEVTQVGANNLAFDNNGNTKTDQAGNTLGYDAWSQEVQYNWNCGCTTTASESYKYDALERRISDSYSSPPGFDCTTDAALNSDSLFYSNQGRVLEDDATATSFCVSASGCNCACGPWTGFSCDATCTTQTFVWGLGYVNDLVLRDLSGSTTHTDAGGSTDTTTTTLGPQRLYAQHDANYNTTALVDTTAAVKERFVYDPYGTRTVLSTGWTTTGDSYGWQAGFQGMWLDTNTGVYHTPNRDYNTALGRWMQQDPAGYVDGANMFQFVDSNPENATDPDALYPDTFQGARPTAGLGSEPNQPSADTINNLADAHLHYVTGMGAAAVLGQGLVNDIRDLTEYKRENSRIEDSPVLPSYPNAQKVHHVLAQPEVQLKAHQSATSDFSLILGVGTLHLFPTLEYTTYSTPVQPDGTFTSYATDVKVAWDFHKWFSWGGKGPLGSKIVNGGLGLIPNLLGGERYQLYAKWVEGPIELQERICASAAQRANAGLPPAPAEPPDSFDDYVLPTANHQTGGY